MSVMVQQTGDAGVNWVHIDNELHRIPPEYQQVKFDSLRHVVAILSSIDPERHLQQLKEQLARTEKLVDRVVEGYHNGFNKAIQNYSRILQLFATAAEQVRRLKRSLEESRRCLCAQSHHLTTQWQKNVVLTQTVRMLEDISVLKDAPAQVDALIRKQDWKLAVKTLMEAGQKLSQPDLRRVGALSRVQSALQARHAQLAKRLLVEIDRRVFYGHAASPAAAKLLRDALQSYQQLLQPAEPEARGDDAEAPADLTLLVQCLSQMGSLSHLKASLASNLRGEIHGAVLRAFHAFLDLSGGKVVTEAGAAAAAAAARPAAQESWQPAALALVADTVPPKVGDRARGCIRVVLLHSALVLRELMELLRCIEAEDGALLGRSGSTGGMALLQQLEALDAVPELGSEADGDGRSTASEAVRGPFSRSTEAAHIWCSIQAELQQVLGVLLHAPLRQASDGVGDGQRGGAGGGGTGGAGGVTAGLLEVPSSSHSDGRHAGDGGSVVSAMTGMLPGASDSASLGSWLSSLYRSKNLPPSGPGAAASALISSLASAPRPSSVPNKWSRRGGRLCFTFDGLLDDLGVEDMLPEAEMGILDRRDSEADLQLLVPRVLGGHPGSPYLTMAVYREVVQFVSCAAQLLPEGVRDGGGGGGLGGRKARAAAQPVLRQALEDFISTTLLPKVWVDFRAKSNDLLEGPEAFQLPSHLKVQLQLASRTGRAVLLSALTLEHMVGELMRWAAAMPLFAPHLTGVVENLLGRFLDAFQGKLAAMASETLTCSLASKADVAGVMMREPSAALLQHCVAFYTPRPGQQFDAASHAAASAKLLASGGSQTEQAMVQLLLKELPKDASGSGLLSNSQTSAALATLALMADSLDYVAEAIALLASGTPPPADGGEAAAASSTARRTSRGYRPSRGPSGRPEDRISSTGVVCFTGGLCMLHDRAKMLAGQCLRMLRLELSLLVLQNLSLLMSRPASGAAAGRSDGREESELFAGGLVRRVVRLEADLGKHLTPDLHLYVFGSLAGFAARALRLLVAGIPSITGHGIEHLMRALSILQQGLKVRGIRSASGATGLPGPASRSEAGDSGRQFDNTRTYLSLLKRPAEELIRLARKQPFRYMPAEWTALLQVDVQGRVVLPGHKDQLAQVLQGRKAQEASKLSSTAKFFSMPP